MNKNKRIYLLLVFALIFNSTPLWAKGNDKIIQIARLQIGYGETLANNKGKDIKRYLNGRQDLPWCAGFVSYVLSKADIKIKYTLRAKEFLNLGRRISRYNLEPGDIVIFSRKGGGHTGIIEQINKNSFISIEGNVGNYPAKVKRITHNFNDSNILGYVRIK